MAVNWQKEPPVEEIGEGQMVPMDAMPAGNRRGGEGPLGERADTGQVDTE